MNLGEALAVKAREQRIKRMAVLPVKNPSREFKGGPPVNLTDEEILQAYRDGRSIYYICKHMKSGLDRVRRILKEAGEVRT